MIKIPKLDETGAISKLHLKNLKEGILPSLGMGVLKIFYKEIIQDKYSFVFAYYDKGEITGVAALTCNYDELLRKIKMRHFIRLFFAILLKFLDNPLTPFKILFSKYPPEPKAELMFLFVDEKFRGKGIGQRLVEATSKKFKELGVKKYKVTVLSENERGKKFYEKMGFEHAGKCDFLNKSKEIYVLDLD